MNDDKTILDENEDLEAQLAALGLFDDESEDDSFMDVNDINDALASLDELGELGESVQMAELTEPGVNSDLAELLSFAEDSELTGLEGLGSFDVPMDSTEQIEDDDFAELAGLGEFTTSVGGSLSADEQISDIEADFESLLGMGNSDDDFDLEAALGLKPEEESSSIPIVSDELDLDKQLEMLLMADQKATDSFEIKDVSLSAPSKSIYDPSVDGMGVVSYVKGSVLFKEEPKKTKLFENVTWGKLIATMLVGYAVIAFGAVMVIYAVSSIQDEQEAVLALAHFLPITVPQDMANNANNIFVNQVVDFKGRPLTLTRITAGGSGTLFFFEERWNPDDYYIFLYNQARQLYVRQSFAISPASGTILKFERLQHNTLFLTLRIECRTTHEFVSFNYRFLEPPVLAAGVYVSVPVHVSLLGDAETSGVTIRHARFDNAASQIHYSFYPNHDGPGLRIASPDDPPNISLRDMMTLTVPYTNEFAANHFHEFGDNGVTIGTAVFSPVFNLDGTAYVTFHNAIYRFVNPEVDILPRDLFDRDQFDPHPIHLGPYTFNLEAMAQQRSLVVLVVHALDENGHRVPVAPGMALRIDIDNGEPIIVQGSANIARIGTDILFNLAPYLNEIRDIPISRYSLIINYVDFHLPQISVPLEMSTVFGMPSFRRDAAESSVREAFHGLLAYKSREMSRAGIVGLSPELRASNELFDIFSTNRLVERPMFGVSIITGDLQSNYDYLAVVEVQWIQGQGREMEYFHEIFEVRARSRDGIWSMTGIDLMN